MTETLFVFGTLVDRYFTEGLLGHPVQTYSEELSNYKKVGLNIVESEGDKVYGVTFEVSKKDLQILDRYEGVKDNFYKRINVMLDSGEEAIAYQLV